MRFVTAATWLKQGSAMHKRLMLLTIACLRHLRVPWRSASVWTHGDTAACIRHFAWGGGLFVVVVQLVLLGASTPVWQQFLSHAVA